MGAPQRPAGKARDEYVSTEELVRRGGMQAVRTADDLAASTDPFESDEEYQAFLDDLYASATAVDSRRRNTQRVGSGGPFIAVP
jgi:hypothetical protein